MKTAFDFIKFALSHAKRETLPANALLPVPDSSVGADGEWEYLYGTTGNKISQALLDYKFTNYYSKKGWSREAYDIATNGFIGRIACDCEGLLDYFLGLDVTANYNYSSWCTDKGTIDPTQRYDIGECFFMANSDGKMTHVGYVCGYIDGGEELVVEERGIRFGCVVTKRSERGWTHHGKPTKKLDYSSPITIWGYPIKFEVDTPRRSGEIYLQMQRILNAAEYKSASGNTIKEDGIWGPLSQEAFDRMIYDYAAGVTLSLCVNGEEVYKAEDVKK